MTASSDRTISTGKSDICLTLAEMFARKLRRDGRERERERGTRGGGAWENEKKKSAVLGSDDL